MSAAALLAQMRSLGVALTASGSRLHWTAPDGVVTPPLLEALKAEKTALLALLTAEPDRNSADLAEAERVALLAWHLGQVPGVGALAIQWSLTAVGSLYADLRPPARAQVHAAYETRQHALEAAGGRIAPERVYLAGCPGCQHLAPLPVPSTPQTRRAAMLAHMPPPGAALTTSIAWNAHHHPGCRYRIPLTIAAGTPTRKERT